MAKTVCIIGAGPSGLVAAKTLLHDAPEGAFSVTVFDKQPRIGGLWPTSKDDRNGLVHPLMLANQSRHTVAFSDLAWEDTSPQFPQAWQIGKYLERYLERYCSFEERRFHLRLGWKVESAEPVDGDSSIQWRVRVKSEDGIEDELRFDYLLVATGFFGSPLIPDAIPQSPEVPVVHSSQYRDIESLLSKSDGNGGKILVVGGQMSGVEIAGTIAAHLSSATHSPGPSPIKNPDKYSLHHIIQRPIWVFPLFTSPAPSAAAPFVPLDIPSYNLNNRPQPLQNTQGHISIDSAKLVHSIYQRTLGTNQSNFSPLLAVEYAATTEPPYLAVSDTYMDFVRCGLITLSNGKLLALDGRTATLSPMSEEISDVAAVVLATGFDASPSIAFLPQALRETLSFSPKDINNPVALAFHGTHHPKISNLGFVGYYRSPYWAVMEMQARFLAEMWSAPPGALPATMQKALDSDTSIERTLALRKDPRASQFPMGDFPWLMQELASALGIEMSPPIGETPPLPHNGKGLNVLTAARYPSKRLTETQKAEVTTALQQTYDTAMAGLTEGKFVARAVFRSLLGEWSLERDLTSRLASHPSGHFSGTAKFLLRQGTKDGRESFQGDLGQEYLYIEEGDFKAANGLTFRATRRYIWRYDEATDAMSVWFAKPEDQKRADYLFHQIEFIVPPADAARDESKGWEANAGHLCIEDFYNVKYEFTFNAVNLEKWSLGYTVNGPKKDYTIDGVYRRITK